MRCVSRRAMEKKEAAKNLERESENITFTRNRIGMSEAERKSDLRLFLASHKPGDSRIAKNQRAVDTVALLFPHYFRSELHKVQKKVFNHRPFDGVSPSESRNRRRPSGKTTTIDDDEAIKPECFRELQSPTL